MLLLMMMLVINIIVVLLSISKLHRMMLIPCFLRRSTSIRRATCKLFRSLAAWQPTSFHVEVHGNAYPQYAHIELRVGTVAVHALSTKAPWRTPTHASEYSV